MVQHVINFFGKNCFIPLTDPKGIYFMYCRMLCAYLIEGWADIQGKALLFFSQSFTKHGFFLSLTFI